MRLAIITAGTKRKTTSVSACSSTPKRPRIQLDCPFYQRHDHQTKSFHHFHSYAVRDRIDLKGDLLTSVEEWDQFKDNCCVLITR